MAAKRRSKAKKKSPARKTPVRALSAAEVSEALGIPQSWIYSWRKEGMPADTKVRPMQFNLEECRRWAKEKGKLLASTGKQGRPSDADRLEVELAGEGVDPGERKKKASKLQGKREKEHWDAIKAKLQALQLQGRLLDAAEVEAGRLARIQAVKTRLERLPKRISPKLVGKSANEIKVMLREAMDEVCAAFAKE